MRVVARFCTRWYLKIILEMSEQENDLVMNGPVEFNMEIFVINDETQQAGKVTVGLGVFEYPTPEKVKNRIAKFEDEELSVLGEGFRIMTKQESWNMIMREKTGQSEVVFALPGGHEWDSI